MSFQEASNKDSNHFDNVSSEVPYLRIHSIDFLKGIAICIIILINMADAWIKNDSRYFYAFLIIILDVFGSLLFTFLSSLTVIFWWKKKMGIHPDKAIRNEILSRAVILILLGTTLNLMIVDNYPFPLNLWGWNILVFIGFSYIVCYYAVRLSRGVRWIIAFTLFFITTPIRELLISGKEVYFLCEVLHFIIVSPNPEITLLPYVGICFFSTIFGERILESMLLDNEQAYMDTFRTLILFGFIFIGLSFFYGYGLVNENILNPTDYPTIIVVEILRIKGIPGVFIRGTAPNLFYGLGVSLIILGIIFYWVDLKKCENYFVNILCRYGNFSLTLYLIHFLGFMMFFHQVEIIVFVLVWTLYIGVLGLLIFIWSKYGRKIGTIEWLISIIRFKKKKY